MARQDQQTNLHAPSSRVLCVNAGSSSIRLDIIEVGRAARSLASQHGSGEIGDRAEFLRRFLQAHPDLAPDCAAHRLVHGGPEFSKPLAIDAHVEQRLQRIVHLAPLHLPIALAWLSAARAALPALPHVGVFDTGFFVDLPELAATYALPRALSERLQLRRYGFHGLAHGSMWRRWSELYGDKGRVITLQLGSGCSAAALLDGRPLDTSMGFTPTEGLIMSTRSGDIDPGLLIHLQRHEKLDADALERLLNRESGLLGLSGSTRDMQRLEQEPTQSARFAREAFAYRIKKYVGAYCAVLGGLDGVLFGGGIGEHSPSARAACLAGLAHFGIALDDAANAAAVSGEGELSPKGARVRIHSIAVDEASELARNAHALLHHGATP